MIRFSGNPRSDRRIPILFLDLEGGYGGSSRSLFYLVANLDRERFEPVVVVRKPGPILERYRAIHVATRVMKQLPSFRPGQRKRPLSFGVFVFQWVLFRNQIKKLKKLIADCGIALMHVNHESLGLTGYLLSRPLGIPWVCHIRTQLVQSVFGRWVYRVINRHANGIIFITDQNLTHFAALVGKTFALEKAAVVRNIMPTDETAVQPMSFLQDVPDRFKILSLSNFSPNRGVDRIVDVAECLKQRGREDFMFYLFGRPAHQSLLTGEEDPYTSRMKSRLEKAGLGSMVTFPGHTGTPEKALAGGDALIKLTREANPWGRDIMEAMTAGLPVITIGAYEGFVENGVNGYLNLHYRPGDIADFLIRLKDDPSFMKRVSAANKQKASRLFNGKTNASLIAELYDELLSGRDQRDCIGSPFTH